MSMRKQVMAKKTIFEADKIIEDQEKNEDQLATWEDAIRYRNMFMVMKKEKVNEDSPRSKDSEKFFSLFCDLSELAQYGPGIRLFFELIKYSAMIFLLMALISIPALYSNADGQSLDNIQLSTNSLAKLSVSNQKDISLVIPASDATDEEFEAAKTENQARIKQFVNDSYDRLLMVSIPDLVYSVIFFFFLIWFHFRSQRIQKESAQQNSAPSHYTIEVKGFPPSISDPKIITAHFRTHFNAQAFECQLARNYYDTLLLHQQEAHLIDLMKSEKSKNQKLGIHQSKKLDLLGKQLQEVYQEIHRQVQSKFNGRILSHDEYPSIKAFVIFNNIDDKLRIEQEYLKMKKCLCTNYPESFKLEGKYPLKLSFKPDEPSNILWENLEVSSLSRLGRTLIVVLLVLIVMLITFVKPVNSSSCPKNEITQAEASSSELYTNCYCMGVSFSDMTSDKDLQDLCWDTWVKYTSTYALTILTGLVIIIVNFILRKTIESLGKFNRYNTLTRYITSMTTKLFLAFFVNTALITLFLQADVYGFIPAVTFSSPIPPLSDLQNDKKQEFSADFDRNWYLTIGTKITVTIFFFVVSLVISEYALAPVFRYFREKKVKKLVNLDVQRVANKLILGPEFSITFYYAQALNVIFTTLFYSSGIPIMLFAGFLILTLQYWIYKYRLLRICRRPPAYDTGLNKRILQILPWSLVLHLAVGIYMYGQPLIFPKEEGELTLVMDKSTDEVYIQTNETRTIKSRAFGVIYLFIMLLVALGVFILMKSYSTILNMFSCLCSSKASVAPISQKLSFEEDYQNIQQRMIPSYNIKMNEQYRSIIQAIELEKKIDSESTPKGNTSPANFPLKDGANDTLSVEQILDKI